MYASQGLDRGGTRQQTVFWTNDACVCVCHSCCQGLVEDASMVSTLVKFVCAWITVALHWQSCFVTQRQQFSHGALATKGTCHALTAGP